MVTFLVLNRLHAPALPLPITFPYTLSSTDHTPKTARGISRLTTSNTTARLMSSYEHVVRESTKRGLVTAEFGLEKDDLKELERDLRDLAERYREGDGWDEGKSDEGAGEDDEW